MLHLLCSGLLKWTKMIYWAEEKRKSSSKQLCCELLFFNIIATDHIEPWTAIILSVLINKAPDFTFIANSESLSDDGLHMKGQRFSILALMFVAIHLVWNLRFFHQFVLLESSLLCQAEFCLLCWLELRAAFCFDDACGGATLMAGVAKLGVCFFFFFLLHINACLQGVLAGFLPEFAGTLLNKDELRACRSQKPEWMSSQCCSSGCNTICSFHIRHINSKRSGTTLQSCLGSARESNMILEWEIFF